MRKPRDHHILTPFLSTLMGTFMKRLASVATLLPTYMKAPSASDPLLLAFPTIERKANRLVLVGFTHAALWQSNFASICLATLALARLALALPQISVLTAIRRRGMWRLRLGKRVKCWTISLAYMSCLICRSKGFEAPVTLTRFPEDSPMHE